jgi:hypothetical protein
VIPDRAEDRLRKRSDHQGDEGVKPGADLR